MNEWTEDDAISEYVVDCIDTWEARCKSDRLLRSKHSECLLVGERFLAGVSHVCNRMLELIVERQAREIDIRALRAELAEARSSLANLSQELERARAFERMVAATAEKRNP